MTIKELRKLIKGRKGSEEVCITVVTDRGKATCLTPEVVYSDSGIELKGQHNGVVISIPIKDVVETAYVKLTPMDDLKEFMRDHWLSCQNSRSQYGGYYPDTAEGREAMMAVKNRTDARQPDTSMRIMD